MQKHGGDVVAWVNPTSPLQTGQEIREVVDHFQAENLDTLITVSNQQVHANFSGKPLNYNIHELFAQTQDLQPVELFVYSIMMWRCKPFLEEYEKKEQAFFVGKVGFYPVSNLTSLIIKRKEDLQLVEYIVKSLKQSSGRDVDYDPVTEDV